MVKAPFTTNCAWRKFCTGFPEVMRALRAASKEYGILPYVMLQPRMFNRKEYKVIVINGTASYVSHCTLTCGRAFSESPHTSLFNFAERAVSELALRCPCSMINRGVVRVDIFMTQSKNMVVNEFESLEADRLGSAHGSTTEEFYADSVIRQMYLNLLRGLVGPLVRSNK